MTNSEAIEYIKKNCYGEWCEDDWREAMDTAIKALEAQEWVPVSKQKPEDGQDVLFCDIDKDIMIGYHNKGEPDTHFSQQGTYERIKNVKKWMLLPEP